jgi:predicted dehydrogenase
MAPINVGFLGYGFSIKFFYLPFILSNPDLKVYAFL